MRHFFSVLFFLSTCSIAFAQQFCNSTPPPGYMENFYAKDKSYFENSSSREANAITYVPIQYHIVGTDGGTGYFSIKDLLQIHCILNQRYASANVQFFMYDVPHYIKSTRFYTMSDGNVDRDMKNANNIANACNVYIVQNAVSSGTSVCGYATFPGSPRQGIVVAKSCMDVNNTTLTHEMGHFLGLAHTFSGWEGRAPLTAAAISSDERVNGSNCATTGDGFCDTPADFYSDRWSCPYTGPKTDYVGDLYNTVHPEVLYMSYSLDACQTSFSPNQRSEMYNVRTTQRTNFNSVTVPSFVEPGISTLVSPISGATSLTPAVSFRWNTVPGATHYHVLVSTVSTFLLNNVKDTIVADTSFLSAGLATSTTYYWKVKAITLGNTCSAYSTVNSFTTSPLNATPAITPVTCPGGTDGSASINIIGGTAPYSFNWSSGEGYNPIIDKAAGVYSVTVTDFGGRVVMTDIIIPQPPVFDIGIFPTGSELFASAAGGTGTLSYSWSNGTNGQIVSPTVGNLTVTVRDALGCSAQKTIYYTGIDVISEEMISSLKLYPNPSTHEQVNLEVTIDKAAKVNLSIYDMTGQLMSTQAIQFTAGKNHTSLDTKAFATGVYMVKLQGENINKTIRLVVN